MKVGITGARIGTGSHLYTDVPLKTPIQQVAYDLPHRPIPDDDDEVSRDLYLFCLLVLAKVMREASL